MSRASCMEWLPIMGELATADIRGCRTLSNSFVKVNIKLKFILGLLLVLLVLF